MSVQHLEQRDFYREWQWDCIIGAELVAGDLDALVVVGHTINQI